MYCKNCGKHLDEQAAICVSCGFKNGDGNKFCYHCGKEVNDSADVCLNCGYKVRKNKYINSVGTKSKLTAGLLGVFLGGFGVHNFYLGYTGRGVAQIFLSLCLFGVGGIWGFIEGIMILCGKIDKDASGKYLVD